MRESHAQASPRGKLRRVTTPIDLDRYFERIAYRGPRHATVESLAELSRAHVTAVPFENLSVLLGHSIPLEPEALFDKIVVRRRGGYCFEQNGLFLEVLRALGFDATPLSARVRLRHSREHISARTHVLVRVILDGRPWLADVGVGAASLTGALRFDEEGEQATPHEPRRIVREEGRWFHQIKYGETWNDVYELTGEEMPSIDRVVGNWYTSTHPESHFKDRLIAARALPNGRRATLLNRDYTIRDASGVGTTTRIESPAALRDVLGEQFGLVGFDERDVARLFAAGTETRA
ncbi:MAG: arylamine N-acetyltransferase [Polyangiaceae bacterium]